MCIYSTVNCWGLCTSVLFIKSSTLLQYTSTVSAISERGKLYLGLPLGATVHISVVSNAGVITVNGKIIARLNNCALLNFRAFRIYLWLKNCGCCTWSHYTIHTQDTRMRINRNSLRLNFCRTGGNRNLAIIKPTQIFCQLRYKPWELHSVANEHEINHITGLQINARPLARKG